MRKNQFLVLIERDEDNMLVASVPALKGCHTQAKSMDLLMKRTKEAIRAYLETEKRPDLSGRFIGMQTIEV